MDQPARRTRSGAWPPSLAAGRLTGQVGHASRMADRERGLHVAEVGDGLERRLEFRRTEPGPRARARPR